MIVEAARRLFKKKGPEKCTMRDIAKDAGVSPATIVVHFKNKTALLEYTLYDNIELNIKKAIETMPRHEPLLDRFMHVAHLMFRFYAEDREIYRVLIRDTFWEPAGDSPRLADQMERYLVFFAQMIENEKASGRIQAGADALVAASSLFYLYLNILMDFLRTPDMGVDEALNLLKRTAHQHLTGILIQGDKG